MVGRGVVWEAVALGKWCGRLARVGKRGREGEEVGERGVSCVVWSSGGEVRLGGAGWGEGCWGKGWWLLGWRLLGWGIDVERKRDRDFLYFFNFF